MLDVLYVLVELIMIVLNVFKVIITSQGIIDVIQYVIMAIGKMEITKYANNVIADVVYV